MQEAINHLADIKTVNDYDWKTLIDTRNIDTVLVKELDKYLKHYNLSTKGKKCEGFKNSVTCSKRRHGYQMNVILHQNRIPHQNRNFL